MSAKKPAGQRLKNPTTPETISTTNQPLSFNDKWIDAFNLRQMLHVSNSTLRNWRNDGVLTYSHIGERIMYSLQDLDKMLEEGKRRGRKEGK